MTRQMWEATRAGGVTRWPVWIGGTPPLFVHPRDTECVPTVGPRGVTR
jgi:hypothetical protein